MTDDCFDYVAENADFDTLFEWMMLDFRTFDRKKQIAIILSMMEELN